LKEQTKSMTRTNTLSSTKTPFYKFIFAITLSLSMMASCQTPENEDSQTLTQTETEVTADTVQAPTRPAPEFFIIPKEMVKTRVWICQDYVSDIFHINRECELLRQCTGTFRNVTLPRAVEDFDRYNCEVCSSELAHIYDEDAVRMETGFGRQ
jgi:hypothetical protein